MSDAKKGQTLNRVWKHLDEILNEIHTLEQEGASSQRLHDFKFRVLSERNSLVEISKELGLYKPRVKKAEVK